MSERHLGLGESNSQPLAKSAKPAKKAKAIHRFHGFHRKAFLCELCVLCGESRITQEGAHFCGKGAETTDRNVRSRCWLGHAAAWPPICATPTEREAVRKANVLKRASVTQQASVTQTREHPGLAIGCGRRVACDCLDETVEHEPVDEGERLPVQNTQQALGFEVSVHRDS